VAHGTFIATGGEDQAVVVTDFSGVTLARLGTKGIPQSILFSGSGLAMTSGAAQMAVSDGAGVMLANMQQLTAGKVVDATVQLEFDSSSGTVEYHCWYVTHPSSMLEPKLDKMQMNSLFFMQPACACVGTGKTGSLSCSPLPA
jgi:hypothetical protein